MSLQGSLDRITAAVERASRVPMSASCVVNRAEILALVDRAKDSLPVEVKDANALLGRREEVLGAARREAESTVTEARRCAEQLVDSSTIVARAHERAEEIVREARAEAEQLLLEADEYCDRRLGAFEEDLTQLLAQVRRGRNHLRDRRAPGGRIVDGDDAQASEPVVDLTRVEPAEPVVVDVRPVAPQTGGPGGARSPLVVPPAAGLGERERVE
jgi:hypothetical protein